MAVSKRLRFEILRRDDHACRYCGGRAPDVKLTIDHVIPVTLGGLDVAENLVAACADCNSGKASSNPDESLIADVAEDVLRWRRAMQVASDLAAADRERREALCEAFEDAWNDWTVTIPSYKGGSGQPEPFDLPGGWKDSVWQLSTNGVTFPEMKDAIEAALGRQYIDDRFAYFVGVCRNKLADKHRAAQQIIRDGLV